MPEFLKPNSEPLNQAAKALLLRAKADADPAFLYFLQLIRWGLENGAGALDRPTRDSLIEIQESFLGNDPEKVMKFLAYPEGKLWPRLDPLTLRAMKPEEAAAEAIELLFDRMAAATDWEPPRKVW